MFYGVSLFVNCITFSAPSVSCISYITMDGKKGETLVRRADLLKGI
jgi:hypothetical protein